MKHVPTESLALHDIPLPEAPLDEIERFASTFNGYKHWGSFEKCAEIANEEQDASITALRTCLFFEQRRWRHFGDVPDKEAQMYWRSLVARIRARFVAGMRA